MEHRNGARRNLAIGAGYKPLRSRAIISSRPRLLLTVLPRMLTGGLVERPSQVQLARHSDATGDRQEAHSLTRCFDTSGGLTFVSVPGHLLSSRGRVLVCNCNTIRYKAEDMG